MLEEFFGKPLSKGINPDEAVAFGAAVQVGLLQPVCSLFKQIKGKTDLEQYNRAEFSRELKEPPR